jgi:nucleoside-triphosphatase THEP1
MLGGMCRFDLLPGEPMPDQSPLTPADLLDAYLDKPEPQLFLLTGDSGSGKTTWCMALVAAVRARGLTPGGVISPPVVEGEFKTGIALVALATGERRLLGVRRAQRDETATTKCWHMDDAVLSWGNDVLAAQGACDLLIVDELGPLEFTHGRGFAAAFDLVARGTYRIGVVIVRPNLLDQARQRWPSATVLTVRDRAVTPPSTG